MVTLQLPDPAEPLPGPNAAAAAASHLGLDVLCRQALRDDVDALRVFQDVTSALRVVHQSFQAADHRRVDLGLGRLVVHGLEEVQDARQAVQVQEPGHKPAGRMQQVDDAAVHVCHRQRADTHRMG